MKDKIVQDFHKLYYDSEVWLDTSWFGVKVQKCPLDLFMYQEIIHEVKPDVIIESGTKYGGSTLFLAHMLDIVGKGKVLTIDIEQEPRPQHSRITYLLGSSTSEEIIEQVKSLINSKEVVLVILDSDHTKKHVLKELQIYSQFVTKNSYLILEDTNINGHPVLPGWGAGPMEALNEFLEQNKDFVSDEKREKFFMTFNPKGFLKKIR